MNIDCGLFRTQPYHLYQLFYGKFTCESNFLTIFMDLESNDYQSTLIFC